MRLTKLVTVALATAALAASSATADPRHGKGKPTCKPAPVMLAGTLANDPATGDTSFQLDVKHSNRLGRLYAKATNPVTVTVDAKTRRSEEHTSELQSPCNLVCRLLLEK